VTSAPAEVVYTPVRPSVFTFGASYADDFYAQLKYIHERMQPANAVYGIIRQDDDLGREIERGYDRAVKQLGLKDGIRLAFKRGTTNFSAEVAQMKAAGVNVLANGAVFAGAANVLSEARKLGMDNLKSAGVRTEGIPASAKLSAPAGYNFMISDYVSITGAAAEEFEKLARKYVSPEEIGAISHYTYVTYLGLKVLAHAMGQCGKNLTRACTVENLRKIKNFETNGLSAPISFDNPKQLSGTAIALFQYDAAAGKFNQLTEFVNY
jgi:ABC-type branched-subunit amino acid transport system substrate-binding protein